MSALVTLLSRPATRRVLGAYRSGAVAQASPGYLSGAVAPSSPGYGSVAVAPVSLGVLRSCYRCFALSLPSLACVSPASSVRDRGLKGTLPVRSPDDTGKQVILQGPAPENLSLSQFKWDSPDWRTRYPILIQDQLVTDFCTPVSLSSLLTYIWYLNSGEKVEFSAQCIINGLGLGLGPRIGSSPCECLFYIQRHGIFTEAECPYTGSPGSLEENLRLMKAGVNPITLEIDVCCAHSPTFKSVRKILKKHPLLSTMYVNEAFRNFKGLVWEIPFEMDKVNESPESLAFKSFIDGLDLPFQMEKDSSGSSDVGSSDVGSSDVGSSDVSSSDVSSDDVGSDDVGSDEGCAKGSVESHTVILHGVCTGADGKEYVAIQSSWGPEWASNGIVLMAVDVMKSWGLLKGIAYPEF